METFSLAESVGFFFVGIVTGVLAVLLVQAATGSRASLASPYAGATSV